MGGAAVSTLNSQGEGAGFESPGAQGRFSLFFRFLPQSRNIWGDRIIYTGLRCECLHVFARWPCNEVFVHEFD